jgi:hypothetical protein
MITPDPVQVERWKEYQTELAKSLLSFLPPEEVLCEWEILGRSDQKVYVWAVCTSIISSGTSPISGTEIFPLHQYPLSSILEKMEVSRVWKFPEREVIMHGISTGCFHRMFKKNLTVSILEGQEKC